MKALVVPVSLSSLLLVACSLNVGCNANSANPAATEDELAEYVEQNPDIQPTPYLPDHQM